MKYYFYFILHAIEKRHHDEATLRNISILTNKTTSHMVSIYFNSGHVHNLFLLRLEVVIFRYDHVSRLVSRLG
jgi:hypothetical protein